MQGCISRLPGAVIPDAILTPHEPWRQRPRVNNAAAEGGLLKHSDYYNLATIPIRETSAKTIMERLVAANLEPYTAQREERSVQNQAASFKEGLFLGGALVFVLGVLFLFLVS